MAPIVPRFVAGDTLELRVYGEDELGGEFQVQDDGTIRVPLVGTIVARGKTQAELTEAVRAALAAGFLRDPQVTIVVKQRQRLEVSVLGHVAEPGRVPFVEKLTLVQAISEAGGFAPGANPRRVKLTRQSTRGVQSFEVSAQAITRGKAPDVMLQPGDIVFVPQSPI